MQFKHWLEAAIGTPTTPLYHAHPDIHQLQKDGFTNKNIDEEGSGIASVLTPQGGRTHYGAGKCIHLTRSLNFAIWWAKKSGPNAGVVEVLFHTRKPIFVKETDTLAGNTHYKAFVDPENKTLTILGPNKQENINKIASTIEQLKTAQQIYKTKGGLGAFDLKPRTYPLPIQAKILAKEFIDGGPGIIRTGWPNQFRDANPAFEEPHFTTIGTFHWSKWAEKGYLDSIWWETGTGPFHGEQEVSVFNPKLLTINKIVFTNDKNKPT
jgi:hypothetical protein